MSTPPLIQLAEGRPVRPRKAPAVHQSELRLHIAVVDLLRRLCRQDWIFFHAANGEHRDPRTAAKLKAMGVRPGVPDLLLLGPDGRLRCIEFKAHGGKLSDEQEAFRLHCVRGGVPFVVVRSIDDALLVFKGWGCLTHEIGGAP